MEDIGKVVNLETFVPRYLNQAIIFTGDDMGGDEAMVSYASLYCDRDYGFCVWNHHQQYHFKRSRCYRYFTGIRLYQAGTDPSLYDPPGAGNPDRGPDWKHPWLYCAVKGVCAGMYYGSYSLPTYVTIWNAEAFLLTTVVPVIIMILINYAVLRYRLQLSPLKFLRRDFSGKKQKRAMYSNPEDRNLSRIPPSCDLSECQQLSGVVCGRYFCQSAAVFRNAPAVCAGSCISWRSRRTCWRNISIC